MRLTIIIVGLAAFIAPVVLATGEEFVRPSLILDRETIDPGEPFRVGVRFAIDPTWHIYWRNPGESGLATEIEWTLPEGFTAGELQWPFPKEFIVEGLGDVNYGYEKEVLLFATVTPPKDFAGETVSIGVETQWLSCGETGTCVPGFAEFRQVIYVGDGAASKSLPLFQKYSNRVPLGVDAVDPYVFVTFSKGEVHVQPKLPWTGIINTKTDPPLLFALEGSVWEYPRLKTMFNAVTFIPYFSFAPRDEADRENMPERLEYVSKVVIIDQDTAERKTIRVQGAIALR